MRAIKTFTDPEAFKLFADETRRKIVFLLRAKEMTASQIAQELELTPQTVYHHIKRLAEGGMIEVSREVRVEHLIESYYQATAEAFHFTVGKSSKGASAFKEQIEAVLDALKRIGFKLQYDDKALLKLVKLKAEMNECCGLEEQEEALSKLDDLDPLTKMEAEEYAAILSVSEEAQAREDELQKKFRILLRSLIKK